MTRCVGESANMKSCNAEFLRKDWECGSLQASGRSAVQDGREAELMFVRSTRTPQVKIGRRQKKKALVRETDMMCHQTGTPGFRVNR